MLYSVRSFKKSFQVNEFFVVYFQSIINQVAGKKSKLNPAKFKNKKFFYQPRLSRRSEIRVKILKPNNDAIIKDRVQSQVSQIIKKRSFYQVIASNLNEMLIYLYPNKIWKNLKHLSLRYIFIGIYVRVLVVFQLKTLVYTAKLLNLLIVLSIIFFTIYLSFFDTFFLIKNWSIDFTSNSYLDNKDVNKLVNNYQNSRFLGIFPSNQYWFSTEQNLTTVAQEIFPEIESVKILERSFPNKLKLEIETKPAFITLAISTQKGYEYWRISDSGKILTMDNANIRQNLVRVSYPISFENPDSNIKDSRFFMDNPEQLNRLHFVRFTWDLLSEIGQEPIETYLPSMNIADTEVTIELENRTKLLFESSKFDKETHVKRLISFLNPSIREEIQEGKIAYIDLRVPKRIFVCKKKSLCDT
jgi:hypothetical protein